MIPSKIRTATVAALSRRSYRNSVTRRLACPLAVAVFLIIFTIQASVQAQQIFTSAQAGNLDAVKRIIKDDPSQLNAKQSSNKQTPLHYAVNSNRQKVVEFLLEKKADVHAKDNYNRTPLHFAAMRGNQKVIDALLEAGADVDGKDRSQMTPIWFAITYHNNSKVLKTMVGKSKNINQTAKNYNGQSYLHIACQYGRSEAAETLIAAGAKVDLRDRQGVTPLMYAFQSRQKKMVDLMLKNKADIKAVDKTKRTMLHWAAMSGSADMMKLLDVSMETVNKTDANGFTPLYQAVMSNSAPVVKYLLSKGADASINPTNKGYQGIVHYALGNQNFDMAKVLVEEGADVDYKDPQGDTPLHFVARAGYQGWQPQLTDANRKKYAEMAMAILAKGADPSLANKQKTTPLEMAVDKDNYLVVDVLIEKIDKVPESFGEGRNLMQWACEKGLINTVKKIIKDSKDSLNKTNSDGQTPLFLAAMNGHADVIDQLLEHKTNVNVKDNNGETPLLVACWNGHEKVVSKLIEARADLKKVDDSGQTSLHLASWRGHAKVVDLLLAKQVNPNSATSSGYTPLHAASWQGHAGIAQKLIKAGAKVDPRDSDGVTPLHKASFKGHAPVVKVLLQNGADKNAKDAIGFTALQKAKGQKKADVVALLEKSD